MTLKSLFLGFEKIILVGHSFGGYLSCCYSLTYPENLERVILVDPWGMTEKPTDLVERYEITFGRRMLFRIIKQFNPLSFLRFSGDNQNEERFFCGTFQCIKVDQKQH